jgi:predicted alpha/beta-fold hydrolase
MTLKFGNPEEQVRIPEGLFYDPSNSFVRSLVNHWPEHYRTYTIKNRATPWMPSGDSRTGLPFLINHWPSPQWHRVFLSTKDEHDEEEEYLALDIAFPINGFQKSSPVYLILHGLNGGSNEEYIRDFTFRSIEEGATVVVLIARGLMDLPIRG